jgi:hypothetical protein
MYVTRTPEEVLNELDAQGRRNATASVDSEVQLCGGESLAGFALPSCGAHAPLVRAVFETSGSVCRTPPAAITHRKVKSVAPQSESADAGKAGM